MSAPARERLVAFLYVLLRDELPSGRVERIMRDHVERVPADRVPVGVYSDRHLEAKARDLADRLGVL